jgi:hypothetical protein
MLLRREHQPELVSHARAIEMSTRSLSTFAGALVETD